MGKKIEPQAAEGAIKHFKEVADEIIDLLEKNIEREDQAGFLFEAVVEILRGEGLNNDEIRSEIFNCLEDLFELFEKFPRNQS